MAAEDTVKIEFYAPWPNLGKKLSEQLGEIRTDTASMEPVIRGIGLDASGDFSNLDGVGKTAVQAWEIGKQDFHNKFRTHYNKTTDVFEIAYNNGTEQSPNWYTTWWIDKDGLVTQQNTPTTASNVGGGQGWFKQKVGVDLEFKTITATSPITLVNDGNSLDVDGSALISNYSSLGGDESIITSKSSNNLPFKGLSAGPNVVLTASGTAIQIESTAQVVEFYGIVVQHADGTAVFPGVHILKVNPNSFYLTKQIRSGEVLLNSRGENLTKSEFVAERGDEMTGALCMFDGTVSLPALTWTDDKNTGIRRRAADDMAFVSGGADIARVLTDRFLTSKTLQVTTVTNNPATPDIFWNPDSDTGLYQVASNDGTIAFATAGVRAGYFDNSQDLFVTNEIKAGDGTSGAPTYSFTGDTNTGMYTFGDDQLSFSVGGSDKFNMTATLTTFTEPLQGPNGSALANDVTYSFLNDTDTGMFRSSLDVLAFATDGTLRMHIQADGRSIFEFPINAQNGSESAPSYAFEAAGDTGMYRDSTTDAVRITADGTSVAWFDSTLITFKTAITADSTILATVVTVNDEVYTSAGWDGDLSVPTKNAIRDYFNDIAGGDITSWTSRTSTADNSWRSVTYGNGLFVAVSFTGSSDRIMTSPDGINWTARTNPVDNDWRAVTYGNGLFVVVASSGTNDRVMTSPDGINWTTRTSPADNNWLSVTYGNGLFVAISTTGTNNRAMTSPDGINWTIRTSAADNAWRSVTYGNGLFVAVTSEEVGGDRVMTSPDGITWTSRTHSVSNNWFSVAYGNGLFVAVSNTGTNDRVMTSPDGITWTTRTSAADNNWIAVTYGSGLFVAVATTGTSDRVMTSPDGITWTSRTSAVDNSWVGVTYGNGMFVAVSQTGTSDRVMTSGKTELNEVSTDNILQGGREVRNDLIVVGDVRASRVEAGLGVFYTSTTSDRFIAGRNGTNSLPAITFINDTDSGLYLPIAGFINMTVGSQNAQQWSAGTITVFRDFRLKAASTAADPALQFASDINTGLFQTAGEDALRFSTGGTEAGYFDANQNLHVTNDIISGGNIVIQGEAHYAKIVAGTGEFYEQLRIADGTAGAPGFAFLSDPNTGIYQRVSSSDTMSITTGGNFCGEWMEDGAGLLVERDLNAGRVEAGIGVFYTSTTSDRFIAGRNGTNSLPAITFINDTDSGLYLPIAGFINMTVGSQNAQQWSAGTITVFRDFRLKAASTAADPALQFASDINTGLFQTAGEDALRFSTGGTEAGYFDSNQDFFVTNAITLGGELVGTPDEITATSTGVAASVTTLNTEVTTNDDNDLDDVTLADGVSGQVKHIYCVASFAGDTWKITPATMLGGSIITFGDNSVGNGCTLVFAVTEGWTVVGNNGGTIS